jgi:hypothetical protein
VQEDTRPATTVLLALPCQRSRRRAATECRPRAHTPAADNHMQHQQAMQYAATTHCSMALRARDEHAGSSGSDVQWEAGSSHCTRPNVFSGDDGLHADHAGASRACIPWEAGSNKRTRLDVFKGDDGLHADVALQLVAQPPGPAARLQCCVVRVQSRHAPADASIGLVF